MLISPVKNFKITTYRGKIFAPTHSSAAKKHLNLIPITYPKIYFTGYNNDFKQEFERIHKIDSKSGSPLIKSVNQESINKLNAKLKNTPNKNVIIGITGKSASGKSTLTKAIAEGLQNKNIGVSVINADNYFKDISGLIKKYGSFEELQKSGYDVDGPNNFNLTLLKSDLNKLENGSDIKSPEYLIDGRGISKPDSIPVSANKVVLVEGIATAFDFMKNAFDLNVYVDIDDKTRQKRFLDRAGSRNQTKEDAINHFNYTEFAASKYIVPNKSSADLVLDGNTHIDYVSHLLNKIQN